MLIEDTLIKVLLVEDNPGDGGLVREALAEADSPQFELAHVERLDKALKRLAEGGIDVVLLDLSLPDGHGLDTVTQAHAAAPDVPIVVLTGLNDEAVAVKAVRDGAQDYLVKGQMDSNLLVRSIRYATERKRAEEERERLLAELEAKNKELESFVYTVSHDLKAPLISLAGFSSALQKEFYDQLGEDGKHYVERIQANVAHMDALIVHLLDLSRIGRVVGPIAEIDVAALLREIQEEVAIELEEAGAEFVVQEPLPAVHADRRRIRQVFANLIDNAVKFRSEERPLRIEVGCREEGGFYRFHVADNGIGIAPQYHEQIFAAFRQLDPETEGVGMGLTLANKIVEHHGGRVWVESPSTEFILSEVEGLRPRTEPVEVTGEGGEGATFYFTLPRERGVEPPR